jgi:thiol-disulfide isomerase/thioredoxin
MPDVPTPPRVVEADDFQNQPLAMSDTASSHLVDPQANAPVPVFKVLLYFGTFMLLGTLFLVWLGASPAPKAVGQPFPVVDLQPLLSAESPLTNEDLKGKFTVIHFWGTWCPPCRLEFPEFVELAHQFTDEPNAQIVSVSCSAGPEYDLDELKTNTQAYLADIDSSMKTYCDPAAMTRAGLAQLLPGGSIGYPTTVLVDRKGVIADVIAGYQEGDLDKLATKLRQLLDQPL